MDMGSGKKDAGVKRAIQTWLKKCFCGPGDRCVLATIAVA